jgi:hypothetical protein
MSRAFFFVAWGWRMHCDRVHARHERSVPHRVPVPAARVATGAKQSRRMDDTQETHPIRDRRDACPRNTRESPGTQQDAAFRKDATEAGVVALEGDDAAEDGATRSGGRRKAASHE